MSRRDEIRARLDAATPAPWLPESGICPHCAADDCWQPTPPGMRSGKGYCEATGLAVYSGPESDADADLVAHAPADLRDLLAVVDAAQTVPVQHEVRCAAWDGWKCDCRVADLTAALARLDAVTGGEQ